MQNKALEKRSLAYWQDRYKGTTAEGIARRVITQYAPSSEELERVVSRGAGGQRADGERAGGDGRDADDDVMIVEVETEGGGGGSSQGREGGERMKLERISEERPCADGAERGTGGASLRASEAGGLLIDFCVRWFSGSPSLSADTRIRKAEYALWR